MPAAGTGTRMGSELPKQYLLLQDRPILQHTLERLSLLPHLLGIVVCLASNDHYWEKLTLPTTKPIIPIQGGAERYHSVLNGLQALQTRGHPQDWVLVHDAARPCVRPTDIEKLMTQLANHPIGGLLAYPVRDTMKRSNPQGEVEKTISRESLWHALTPQMFRLNLLMEALQYVLHRGLSVTDEAQAMEYLGYHPVLVEGHADNIKITHPQDLVLATLFINTPLL